MVGSFVSFLLEYICKPNRKRFFYHIKTEPRFILFVRKSEIQNINNSMFNLTNGEARKLNAPLTQNTKKLNDKVSFLIELNV